MNYAHIASILALAATTGEIVKYLKKHLWRAALHAEVPVKQVWESKTPGEAGKIALLDATEYVPTLHDLFQSMLDAQQQAKGAGGWNIFLVSEAQRILSYFNGVIHTGDPLYGGASVLKSILPVSELAINQLQSQQGLIAAQNLAVIARLYGDPNLVKPFDGGSVVPTPLSPIRQELANALFSGDVAGARIAAAAFIAKAAELGYTPDKAQQMLQSSLTGMNPYQRAFGQKLTDQQRADFLAGLPPAEANQFAIAEGNWTAAMQAIGTGAGTLTRQAQGSGGGAGPSVVSAPRQAASPQFGGGLNRFGSVGGGLRAPASNRLRGVGGPSRLSGAVPRAMHLPRLSVAGTRLGTVGSNRLRRRK